MSCTTILLLLAAATSAEGNLMPWQTPALKSVTNYVKQVTTTSNSNGRRLSKLVSAECIEKCPDTMEFIMKMGEAGDMGDDMEKMMEVMCPFKDAIVCIATSPVCIDEGAEEQMAGLMAIPCLCACP